jgi:hypothetical protein
MAGQCSSEMSIEFQWNSLKMQAKRFVNRGNNSCSVDLQILWPILCLNILTVIVKILRRMNNIFLA